MKSFSDYLEGFTHRFVKWAGTSSAFVCAFGGILLFYLLSKFYWKTENASPELNTFINLIMFLLIFLLQRSQNKEFKSIQVKLNELISTHKDARNELINIENASEADLQKIHDQHEDQKH